MRKSKILKLYSCWLSVLVLFLINFSTSQAATPNELGRAGWLLPVTDYVGPDSTTCPIGFNVGKIELSEHDSKNLITDVPNWSIELFDSSNSTVFSWNSASQNTSPQFCFQHNYQIEVIVDENNSYYEMRDKVLMGLFGVPTENSYVGRVHLQTKAKDKSLLPMFPQDGGVYNSGMLDFIVNLQNIPNIYDSYITSTRHVIAMSLTSGLYSNFYISPTTGIVNHGAKNLPSGLPDGFYSWSVISTMRFNTTLSNGTALSHFVNNRGTKNAYFTIDRSAPATSVSSSHNSTADVLTISNTVKDSLSGTKSTTIYARELSPGNSITSAVVPLSLGSNDEQIVSFDLAVVPGATYEYYAVTTDVALNISTSSTDTFTAPITISYPDLISQNLTVSAAPYYLGDNISVFSETSNVGSVDTPSTFTDAFYFSFDSTNWTEIHDNSNQILPAGDSTTDSALYTTTQPGNLYFKFCTDIYNDIDEGTTDDTLNCSIIGPFTVAAGYPDLGNISLKATDSSLAAGPYIRGEKMILSAVVKNYGLSTTPTSFYDLFSYSWDNTNWSDVAPSFLRPPLDLTHSFNDKKDFYPLQTGTVYIKHCVDVTDVINEGANVKPNCIQGSFTVSDCLSGTFWDSTSNTCVSTPPSSTSPDLTYKVSTILFKDSLGNFSRNFKAGDAATLQISVENKGDESTDPANSGVTFTEKHWYRWNNFGAWIATSPPLDTNYSATFNKINAGDVEVFYHATKFTEAGNLYIKSCIDDADNISESDETNNCIDNTLSIQITPTTELAGSACTISNGNSSCNTGYLNWNLLGYTLQSVKRDVTLNNCSDGTLLSTDKTQNNYPIQLNHGSNKFSSCGSQANTSGSFKTTKTITLTADCLSSSYWNGSTCQPNPTLSITTDKLLVRSGDSVPVTTTVSSPVNLSCTMYGVKSDPQMFGVSQNTSKTVLYDSKEFKSAQIILLKCTSASAPGVVFEKEIRISVVPDRIEI